jgi:hypothetical protein
MTTTFGDELGSRRLNKAEIGFLKDREWSHPSLAMAG